MSALKVRVCEWVCGTLTVWYMIVRVGELVGGELSARDTGSMVHDS